MFREDERTQKRNKTLDRMRTAYHKNRKSMNDDDPERNDSIARQKKLDDLEKRSKGNISWSGLRERQLNAIKRQEEFSLEGSVPNPFEKYTWEEVCDAIDDMNDKQLDEFMDKCGVNDIDELWDYIGICFSLEEAG
jgi:hypothetical protein